MSRMPIAVGPQEGTGFVIHRVWLGCIGVLCQLDATVPMRAELEQWMPTFRPVG